MKLNNYEWHEMASAIETFTFWVDRFNYLTLNELNNMRDNFFRGFKNPERIAMTEEAYEDLEILGFRFTHTDLIRNQTI
jgi:hypothetical protein